MTEFRSLVLTGLPKFSLNGWYSGGHWSKRKKLKDIYKLIIKSQFNIVFPVSEYEVEYSFSFKKYPLDATNCTGMTKLIEDIIFEDDGYKIIKKITIRSFKGESDFVKILVKEMK